MNQKHTLGRWTVEDSADLYQIRELGAGYFSISKDGDVIVTPTQDQKHVSVNLPEIIEGIKARGYDMPVLLRFEDILDSQIVKMHETSVPPSPVSITKASSRAYTPSRSTSRSRSSKPSPVSASSTTTASKPEARPNSSPPFPFSKTRKPA
jgi:hypothetical protein